MLLSFLLGLTAHFVPAAVLKKLALFVLIAVLFLSWQLSRFSKKHVDTIFGLYRRPVLRVAQFFPPLALPLYLIARFGLPACYLCFSLHLFLAVSMLTRFALLLSVRACFPVILWVLVLFDHKLLLPILFYHHTAYYKQTKTPLRTVLSDKGTWGEFFAYLCFEQEPTPKKYIFNAMVPKWNHPDDFAEIDMIVLSRRGIQVVEVKNRTGTFCGHILSPKWTQKFDNGSEVELDNPVLQNQNHVIALENYLADHGFSLDPVVNSIIFLSDSGCTLDIDGALGYHMGIANRYQLSKMLRGLEIIEPSEREEELFSLLSALAARTPEEHAERVAQRSNYLASSASAPTYYFVEAALSRSDAWYGQAVLYRCNSFGLSALWSDHFWHPIDADRVSPEWLNRLPYCQQQYPDLTSFRQAQRIQQALEAAMKHVLPTLSRTVAPQEVCRILRQEMAPSFQLFYISDPYSGVHWTDAPLYAANR